MYIIHSVNKEEFENEIKTGSYGRKSLEKCGFIHCSDLDTYGFFGERKVIYANDAFFLTTSKGEIEHNIDSFIKYINNPSPDNILIISCSKLDGKKNICKLVKEKFNCITINNDPKDFIKKKTKDYKITYDTINYLISEPPHSTATKPVLSGEVNC